MLGTLFLILAVFVILAALWSRSRVKRRLDGDEPITGDPLLREILSESDAWDEDDEPLDEDRIREEEDRFWAEEWDQPEDWRG
jgi:hypothetical protein